MKTFIVLIPVTMEELDSRPSCESIENTSFEITENRVQASDVRKEVCRLLKIKDNDQIEVEPITDFMDRVNDEKFDDNGYFMSYVQA